MEKINFAKLVRNCEFAKGITRKYDVEQLEQFGTYYGVINQMIESEICYLGDIEMGNAVPADVYIAYDDIGLIVFDGKNAALTEAGKDVMAIWSQLYRNEYGYAPADIRHHWSTVSGCAFYRTSWANHYHITRLMDNSPAAFERMQKALRCGVPFHQSVRELQHYPIINHAQVWVPTTDSDTLGFTQVYLPTNVGMDNLRIAASSRGVIL